MFNPGFHNGYFKNIIKTDFVGEIQYWISFLGGCSDVIYKVLIFAFTCTYIQVYMILCKSDVMQHLWMTYLCHIDYKAMLLRRRWKGHIHVQQTRMIRVILNLSDFSILENIYEHIIVVRPFFLICWIGGKD